MNELLTKQQNGKTYDAMQKFAAQVNESLINDNHVMNIVIEKFTEIFADVSKMSQGETMEQLVEALREAGRADLADQIVRGMQ